MIPLTLAPFIGGSLNPLTDALLGTTLLIHSYIGFQACIIDYFPGYRMPGVQKALMWLLRFATVLTGIGWYEFETSRFNVLLIMISLTDVDQMTLVLRLLLLVSSSLESTAHGGPPFL